MVTRHAGFDADAGRDAGADASADTGQQELVIDVQGLVNRFGSQVVHDKLDLQVRRGEILFRLHEITEALVILIHAI